MRTKTTVVFWAAVSTAIVLLGGAVATIREGVTLPGDLAVLMVSALGAAASLVIAGRIVWVLGRTKRTARRA